jgi:drug/metabolite transporter (DMT)-like permease
VTALFLWIVKRREPAMGDARERWSKAWPWVLLNGLTGPALGVSCYQWALKTAPTGIVLPIVAITPIVIIPFSRYIEGERPTWRSLAGGLVAVIGAVLLALVRA